MDPSRVVWESRMYGDRKPQFRLVYGEKISSWRPSHVEAIKDWDKKHKEKANG